MSIYTNMKYVVSAGTEAAWKASANIGKRNVIVAIATTVFVGLAAIAFKKLYDHYYVPQKQSDNDNSSDESQNTENEDKNKIVEEEISSNTEENQKNNSNDNDCNNNVINDNGKQGFNGVIKKVRLEDQKEPGNNKSNDNDCNNNVINDNGKQGFNGVIEKVRLEDQQRVDGDGSNENKIKYRPNLAAIYVLNDDEGIFFDKKDIEIDSNDNELEDASVPLQKEIQDEKKVKFKEIIEENIKENEKQDGDATTDEQGGVLGYVNFIVNSLTTMG